MAKLPSDEIKAIKSLEGAERDLTPARGQCGRDRASAASAAANDAVMADELETACAAGGPLDRDNDLCL